MRKYVNLTMLLGYLTSGGINQSAKPKLRRGARYFEMQTGGMHANVIGVSLDLQISF
jgi:hypothetical protein